MLTSKKIEMGIFQLNLLRTDIIPIVNYAWERSFAKINSNLKACQDRGWGPLNKKLLSHPDIVSSKPNSLSPQHSPASPKIVSNDNSVGTLELSSPIEQQENKEFDIISNLNITNGFAGETLCSILRKMQRDAQTLKNLQTNKQNGIDFVSSMKDLGKWSAGVIFDRNKCHLNEEVLMVAHNHLRKKEEEFWKKVKKCCCEYSKKKEDYEKAIDELKKRPTHNNLPIKILRPLCAWKKRKGDQKMPVKQNELFVRWDETKHRDEMSLESYLMETTILFETYERDHRGTKLTMNLINEMINMEDDIGTNGAVPIVQPNIIVGTCEEV